VYLFTFWCNISRTKATLQNFKKIIFTQIELLQQTWKHFLEVEMLKLGWRNCQKSNELAFLKFSGLLRPNIWNLLH